MSQKNTKEERVMHSRNNNIKFSSYNNVNEVVDDHFVQDIKKI